MNDFYKEYKNPKWQKLRLKILERDGFMCQYCQDKEEELHVHHKYYEKGKRIWEYNEDAFITLCKSCHEEETSCMKEVIPEFMNLMKKLFNSSEINDFMISIKFNKSKLPNFVLLNIISRTISGPLSDELVEKLKNNFFEAIKQRK